MNELIIMNGRVVDPASKTDAVLSILVKDGKILRIEKDIAVPKNADVIDAKGMVVCSGFIDMHVHLRDPGFEYKEDIKTGSRAAANGGFTTICSMPNTNPVNDSGAATEYILKRAREVGLSNIRPIGSISRGLLGEELSDIGDMAKAGVVALSDDGRPVMNANLMRRAFEYAMAFSLPIVSHCEDLNLARSGTMNEGAVSTRLGLRGIPSVAEESMLARDIMLAKLTGAHLHVAHVSTKGSVALIRAAKKDGVRVTAEATPHHLTLTDEACADYDPNTKVNPPLRTEDDRLAVVDALADGTIDVVATDHAPHAITDKEAGFEDAAFGMVGLETALPLILKLVHAKKFELSRMIDAMSLSPAKILNLKGKGELKIGFDADITIFDPDSSYTISAASFASKSKNTPFDGWHVTGKVLWTICCGKIIYNLGIV